MDKGQLATISYWHKEYGDGEITVDLNNLAVIKEEKVEPKVKPSSYPPELLSVQSPLDGMQVRWLKVGASSCANEYYALRWETLGKRRFYEAPEIPVEPTVLKLYKLSEMQ